MIPDREEAEWISGIRNPRVGGSSPPSGIAVNTRISSVRGHFRALPADPRDRYEPHRAARRLTKQSNEQSSVWAEATSFVPF